MAKKAAAKKMPKKTAAKKANPFKNGADKPAWMKEKGMDKGMKKGGKC